MMDSAAEGAFSSQVEDLEQGQPEQEEDTTEGPSAPSKITTSYRASAGQVLPGESLQPLDATHKVPKAARKVRKPRPLPPPPLEAAEEALQDLEEGIHKAVQAPEKRCKGVNEEKGGSGGGGKSPEEKDEKEKVSSLKHGKFSTDGRIQHFVYISTEEVTDLAAKSSDLFDTILRHWNLPRPQLLIRFQSGFAHPKYLLDEKEIQKFMNDDTDSVEVPEIRKYFEHFREYVRQQQPGDNDEEEDIEKPEKERELEQKMEQKEIDKAALKLLNQFLFKSLSNLIDVIVRAAVRNRCWILVEGGPNGGLMLLKQAAEKCTERPVILVMDAFKRGRYSYPKVEKNIASYSRDAKLQDVETLDDLVKMEGEDSKKAGDAKKKIIEKMTKSEWEKFEKEREKKRAKGRRPSTITTATTATKASKKSNASSQAKEEAEWNDWTIEDQQEVEDIRMESSLMTTRLLRHAKPIDKPDLEPLKLGVDFWDVKSEENGWQCQSAKYLSSKKVKWNHWHFRGGTHYIFTDAVTSDLLTDCLAPSGCIFLGGGDSSKKELMRMLINGEPVVCLDNTGRLTQDFVRCHNYLCRQLFRDKAEKDQEVEDLGKKKRYKHERSKGWSALSEDQSPAGFLPRQETTDFLKGDIARRTVFKTLTFDGLQGTHERNQMVGGMRGNLQQVTSFTQPELCELFLTYLRRGLQITKLCVVMDPLNPRECSGGHTEDKLSMCLSNFVILASNDTSDFADVEAVKAASRLEDQLMAVAQVERLWALFMQYMLLTLNFCSLLLALARNSTAPIILTWMPPLLLRWGLPGVSAASTFISGLVARFRFTLRWSKARSAAAQLQAEIWKFRTRVGDYVVVGSREDEDGSYRTSELGQAFTRERKQDVTRSLFRANVTNIFNTAMEEMGTSSLHGHGCDELPRHSKSSKKKLSGPWSWCPKSPWCCRRRPKEGSQKSNADTGVLEQSDLTAFGHIGVDDYYHQRTLSVFERMKSQASWLTFLQAALESCVLLLGTSGVLLSTFGDENNSQAEMAMICLSLAASCQTLERFHALSNRLDAANSGERDLICAWQEWSAMEPMQRRFQSNVNRLVLTTEGVNVALTSAATAGVRQTLTTTKSN